jgi:hypothetical protein
MFKEHRTGHFRLVTLSACRGSVIAAHLIQAISSTYNRGGVQESTLYLTLPYPKGWQSLGMYLAFHVIHKVLIAEKFDNVKGKFCLPIRD